MGQRYHMKAVRNDPPPIQEHLPILIGGGGERKTLRTVARFADLWDVGGDVETLRHKDEVLRRWCDEVGRDQPTIERNFGFGGLVIRDDPAEARRVAEEMTRRSRDDEGPELVGTPDEVVAYLRPYRGSRLPAHPLRRDAAVRRRDAGALHRRGQAAARGMSQGVERETGFEPATSCLEGRCSTN